MDKGTATDSEPTTVEKQSSVSQKRLGQRCSRSDIRLFQLGSGDHLQELRTWCQFHWEATFRRAIQTNNVIYYHDCCTCFSKRGFLKKSGHPMLQSCSIAKMPTLMQARSHDEFYGWIKSKLQDKERQGREVVFPSINRFHIDMDASEDEESHEADSLGKRYDQLLSEKREMMERVKRLSTENQVLLASSKDWMLKYIQLTTHNNAPDEEPDLLWTPTKLA